MGCRRVALLTDRSVVSADALGLSAGPERQNTEPEIGGQAPPFRDAMGSLERAQLLEALGETQWNVARAAARLQIPRGTLRYRIEKLGLRRSGVSPARSGPAPTRSMPEPAPSRAGPGRGAPSWERRQLAFVRSMLAALLAWGGSSLLKRIVRRPRPAAAGVEAAVPTPGCHSFPSGHAAAATAFFVALVLVAHPFAYAVGLWAVLITVSRFYLGVHYPTDLVGGVALGAACGAIVRLAPSFFAG